MSSVVVGFTLAVTAVPASAATVTISTAAGTGVAGNSGDGEPATSAELTTPAGVAVDGAGNVFIADFGADVVREIAPTGLISTVAGTGLAGYAGDGGPAAAATLDQPTDVVVGPNGWIYIADSGNHVVRAVHPDGTISTVAGDGRSGYLGDGRLGTAARLQTPVGLDVDTTGNLWIADYGNGTVRKLNTAGVISTVAGTGTPGYGGDGGPATAALLDNPGDVVKDGSDLYIADAGNARVRRVDAAGVITTIAGTGVIGNTGDGGPATAATMAFPSGLAMDSSGNLFVADYQAHVIRAITGGQITTVAGNGTMGYSGDGGPATSAMLANPARVNLDASGDLYVSDWTNHRVRAVVALGTAALAPDAPTGVTGTAGDKQVDLSWTAPDSDGGSAITGYTVTGTDGTTTIGPVTVDAASTTTTITGLTNGTGYTFTVTATNTVGSSPASSPSATLTPVAPAPVPTAPAAPTGVTGTAGDKQVDLSWTAPGSDGGSAITGYTVTGTDGTTTIGPVTVDAASTTTTITGLTNGTGYTFTVTATNTVGGSPASSPSATLTPVAPPAGTTSGTGGTTSGTGGTTSGTGGTTSGTGGTGGTTTGTGGSGGGTSGGTTSGTGGTTGGTTGGSGAAPIISAPSAPTGVTTTAADGAITVTWSAPSDDGGSPLTGYLVTVTDGSTASTVAVGADRTRVGVTGLTNGVTYTVTVTASNSTGPSPASEPVRAVPAAASTEGTGPTPDGTPGTTDNGNTGTTHDGATGTTHDGGSTDGQPPTTDHDTTSVSTQPVSAPAVIPAGAPSPASVPAPPPTHRHHHHHHHRASGATHPAPAAPATAAPDTGTTTADATAGTSGHQSVLAVLGPVVKAVSKNGALPVALLVMVGLFVFVQDQMDRRDPKLALAPVYADPGVSFVPAMS